MVANLYFKWKIEWTTKGSEFITEDSFS